MLARLSPIFVLVTQLQAADPKGVLVYKDSPNGREDFASVREYLSIEKHGRVVNYTPVSGGSSVRVERSRFVGSIQYPDLTTSTIASQNQIDLFSKLVGQLQQVLTKYPKAVGIIDDDLRRLAIAQQMLGQGKVLVAGQWKSKEEYEAAFTPKGNSVGEFTVGERTYTGAKLTSVFGSSVKFMHSGGVGSSDISELTDEQITQLNSTSSSVKIDREELMATAKSESEDADESRESGMANKAGLPVAEGSVPENEGGKNSFNPAAGELLRPEILEVLDLQSKGTPVHGFNGFELGASLDEVAAVFSEKHGFALEPGSSRSEEVTQRVELLPDDSGAKILRVTYSNQKEDESWKMAFVFSSGMLVLVEKSYQAPTSDLLSKLLSAANIEEDADVIEGNMQRDIAVQLEGYVQKETWDQSEYIHFSNSRSLGIVGSIEFHSRSSVTTRNMITMVDLAFWTQYLQSHADYFNNVVSSVEQTIVKLEELSKGGGDEGASVKFQISGEFEGSRISAGPLPRHIVYPLICRTCILSIFHSSVVQSMNPNEVKWFSRLGFWPSSYSVGNSISIKEPNSQYEVVVDPCGAVTLFRDVKRKNTDL